MFISKAEKASLFRRIELLEQAHDAGRLMFAPPKRRGRTWSPEQRAQASERMLKLQAERKAKKAAA
tara:strand:+ start:8824 stop:9021 length:198 start_codon:yes stop_codon:yes gene_type:complete